MTKLQLTPEQVEFFTELVKNYSTAQIASALKERDRGQAYRSDRGKADRLCSKLARSGNLLESDMDSINSVGLVGWFRSR